MNFSLIFNLIGQVLKYECLLMALPLGLSLFYRDGDTKFFVITMLLLAAASFSLTRLKTKNRHMHVRDGFLTVSLAWVFLSFFGALPYEFSGYFASFIDCIFESISGFTTTGATILTDIEILPRGILFWRSFTHWIGGMGVLVFMLAIMPSINPGAVQLLKAESPGPNPGKFMPKIKDTAKIMYSIYFLLTMIQVLLLMMSGMPFFDSMIHAMGSAGTGGFSNMNLSVGAYNNVTAEVIITVFMILFGVNFNLYFYLLNRDVKAFFKNEELRLYLAIIGVSTALITINLMVANKNDFLFSLRHSSFQVASIITTTGYSTVNFDSWPSLSKMILMSLMFVGACAGSTGGAIKVTRIQILFKAVRREIEKILHPDVVRTVKLEGKNVEEKAIRGISLFIFLYCVVIIFASILVCLDNMDLITSVTAVISTIGNVGPGLEIVGPLGNYSVFSPLSKLVLSFCMLAGRLELFPLLVLLTPSAWKKSLVR